MDQSHLSHAVFFASLLITLSVAVVGRRVSRRRREDDLAGRSLNRWLVGLSAGATGNSGFVVTGAVGLGYTLGTEAILLPMAWLIGDLVFWRWFPHRINALGRRSGAMTLAAMLRHGLSGPWATSLSLLATGMILLGLAGYTVAQWLAGQKFLSGAFGLSEQTALILFVLFIVLYSGIGGFRGSVYGDTFQAVVRLVGVTLVLGTAIVIAVGDGALFRANVTPAGASFLQVFSDATLIGVVGFAVGWAAAALGFGLAQPQVVSRYLAAGAPLEARAARWIFIGYVQFTWASMTIFGILLRGIMPDVSEPEAGLSLFIRAYFFPIATGIIVADVFGVIASTANSLLIAMAQSIRHDLLACFFRGSVGRFPLGGLTLMAGVATMVLSTVISGSVASVALSSISMVGAGLAVPVMIKVMDWPHTAPRSRRRRRRRPPHR